MTATEIAAVIAAYLVGAVPFGLLFARALTGRDPRQHGSGNIGATNALRTSGKMVGALTLLADIIKGAIPVAVAIGLDASELVTGCIALAAFLGHIFPIYLGFKGGKGVATMFGVVIPWLPWAGVGAFVAWLILFRMTRLVALASIAAGISLPLFAGIVYPGWYPAIVCLILGAVMIVRHQSNIRRMIAGEEPRTSLDGES